MSVHYSEETWTNGRSQKLFRGAWVPAGEPSALVVFHTGIGEHIGRYNYVFTKLAEAGMAVYAYDMYGQGKSEPKQEKYRCYVHNYQDMVTDYQQFVALVKAEHTAGSTQAMPPVISLSQSLGGLVACLLEAQSPGTFAGLALHSAAIDVEWTLVLKMQAPLGGCLAGCVPFAPIVPAVRPQDMSQEPQVVKEYLEDPLNYTGDTKARTGNEVLKGFKALPAMRKNIAVPIYACHGTTDRCTSIKAVKDLLGAVSSKDTTFNAIEGGYHELLLGPEKEACIAILIAWLKAQSAAAVDAPAVAADTSGIKVAV